MAAVGSRRPENAPCVLGAVPAQDQDLMDILDLPGWRLLEAPLDGEG